MFKLPIRTWVCNAAAVFAGRHGAVTQQAEQAGCSRETVYEHAQKIEQRLADSHAEATALAEMRQENQRLRQEIATLRRQAQELVRLDRPKQRRLATTAFAMGLSLRQIEDVLGLLLSSPRPSRPIIPHSVAGSTSKPSEPERF